MATIYREVLLPVSLEQAWDLLRQPDQAHRLISFLTQSEVEGDRRVCTMADGNRLEERILSIDPGLRRVAYTIEKSPFGLEFHAASMQVVDRPNGTTFVWTTDLKPDSLADQVAPMVDAEVETIRAAFQSHGEEGTR